MPLAPSWRAMKLRSCPLPVALGLHGEPDVGAVEAEHVLLHIAREQLLGDVGAGHLVGGRRQRDDRYARKPLAHAAQLGVFRPEGRAPLRDASGPRRWRTAVAAGAPAPPACGPSSAAPAPCRGGASVPPPRASRRPRSRRGRCRNGCRPPRRRRASAPPPGRASAPPAARPRPSAPPSPAPGTWKHSDLPEPVGITARALRPASSAAITASWPGRKPAKPNTSSSTRRAAATAAPAWSGPCTAVRPARSSTALLRDLGERGMMAVNPAPGKRGRRRARTASIRRCEFAFTAQIYCFSFYMEIFYRFS